MESRRLNWNFQELGEGPIQTIFVGRVVNFPTEHDMLNLDKTLERK